MKVEKIDHIHFNTSDIKKPQTTLEGLIGKKMPLDMDLTDLHGMLVAFHPFPLGIEIMQVTNTGKDMAKIYAESPEGIFAVSLKVPNIDDGTAEMESMGYKLLLRYDLGPVKEALFDTRESFGVFFELIEYPGENIFDLDEAKDAASDAVGGDNIKFE